MKALDKTRKPIFIVFTGTPNDSGHSWCSDCVEGIIRRSKVQQNTIEYLYRHCRYRFDTNNVLNFDRLLSFSDKYFNSVPTQFVAHCPIINVYKSKNLSLKILNKVFF